MIKTAHLFLSLSILAATGAPAAASALSTAKPAAASRVVARAYALPQNRNAINGVVANTENRALYRIRVELLDEVEMSITQTYTDSAGRYSFRNLTLGTFIVKAHADGNYVGQSARVSLYAARMGGGAHYEQLDFVLKTRDQAKGPSVPSNSGPAFAQEAPAISAASLPFEPIVKTADSSTVSFACVTLARSR